MKISVINGPNLNMLGKRDQSVYGRLSLDEIYTLMSEKALTLNLELSIFQSNSEGEIIDAIHNAVHNVAGLIINPAGYTHTSVAIRDALLILEIPIIEVHLSNIYARETFRRVSIIADVVRGQISGLGSEGYLLALEAILFVCNNEIKTKKV